MDVTKVLLNFLCWFGLGFVAVEFFQNVLKDPS